MSIADDVANDVQLAILDNWDRRDGVVVPDTSSVKFRGGGVDLEAVFLYSDLADSTSMAMWNQYTTARVCKAFLSSSTRLIRHHGGAVRSFDGDRVMGVFVGSSKNTSAVKCALRINWMFNHLLRPKFEAAYEEFRNGKFSLRHCSGVDRSMTIAVRAGIRDNDDIIWVGRAANIAAKLSAIRDTPYHSFITGDVFDAMTDEAKTWRDGQAMWEERSWTQGPVKRIFRSSWWWSP